MAPLVPLPKTLLPFLSTYLPSAKSTTNSPGYASEQNTKPSIPFVTLTYAQSLDSRISKEPGVQTVISHLETKTMTHFIRSKHDSILVGINTVLADDPGLNCRFEESLITTQQDQDDYNFKKHFIKPIIVDPKFKLFDFYLDSRLKRVADEKQGYAPVVIVDEAVLSGDRKYEDFCQEHGITLIALTPGENGKVSWSSILKSLKHIGIESVMIEGGATVINDLLAYNDNDLGGSVIDSLIITIGPIFLGKNGVEVSPSDSIKFTDVEWWTGEQDAVMCARLDRINNE